MKFKKVLLLMLVAVLALAGCAGAPEEGNDDPAAEGGDSAAAEPQVWKFVHEEYPGDYQDIYAQLFKEKIEERTDGQITIDIYPVGQLGDAVVGTELIQNGGVQIGITDPGAMGSFLSEANMTLLHFLLPDNLEKVQNFFDNSNTISLMNDLYAEKNLQVIRWVPEGYFVWTGDRPLNTPDQFEGFKMRTMPAPIIAASFEAYGANATPVPYAEVYSALQLGVVNGQTNPLVAVDNMKFYEVQDYATFANADIYHFNFVINKDLWESLDAEMQQLIKDIDQEVLEEYTAGLSADDAEIIDRWKSEGAIEIVEVTDEEREVFYELSQPVFDQFRETGGDRAGELLDIYYDEIDEYK